MNALLVGRFNAVTRAQAEWLASLRSSPVERLVCVVTSADHSATRRNPFDFATREAMLRPSLTEAGKPYELVQVADVPESARWVEHVCEAVQRERGLQLTPENTRVYSSNREVESLFRAKGFAVVSAEVKGLTPQELLQRVVDGTPWEAEASEATRAVLKRVGVVETLRRIFQQSLLTEDGELGHQRDFASYGAQMDAALRQKLEDLVRWVKPGFVVDKGCGTGMLLVELSKLFPDSRFVGVDLSRELLRRCDENTYGTDDVQLVYGNVIERSVADGSATSIIYSSVMHEVHSYTGYRLEEIERALKNAWHELAPGGHVLIRDGVSPPPATWRMRFLDDATAQCFERFAKEFKHGVGAKFERVGPREVRLASHDANEFICKKDYQTNWHIEVHEEFGPHTLEGWREVLTKTGFDALHLVEVANPWIVTHRYEGKLKLFDDAGTVIGWPATNCVVVGRKARRATEPM